MNQNWFTGVGQTGGVGAGGAGGGGEFGQQQQQQLQSWGNQQTQGWVQGGQWAGQPHTQQTGFYGNQQQFQQYMSGGQFMPPMSNVPQSSQRPAQQSQFLSQQAYAQEHERRVREERKKKEIEEQKKKLQSLEVGKKSINLDDLFEKQLPDVAPSKLTPHSPAINTQSDSKTLAKEKQQSGKARSWVSDDFSGLFTQHQPSPPPPPPALEPGGEGDFGDFQSSDQTSTNLFQPSVLPVSGQMMSSGSHMVQSSSHMISTSSYQEPLSSVNVQQGYQGSQPPLSPKKQLTAISTQQQTYFPQQSIAGGYAPQQGSSGQGFQGTTPVAMQQPVPPSQGGAVDPNVFHPLYHKVYRLCKRPGDDLVSTDLLYPVLMSSKLSRSQLRDLWARANRGKPGQLTQMELFILLGLVGLAQSGNNDPSLDDLKRAPSIPVPTLPGLSALSPSSSTSSSSFFSSSLQQPPSSNDTNQFQSLVVQPPSLPMGLQSVSTSFSTTNSLFPVEQPQTPSTHSLLVDHSGTTQVPQIKHGGTTPQVPLIDHSRNSQSPSIDHSGTTQISSLANHSGTTHLNQIDTTQGLRSGTTHVSLANHSGTKQVPLLDNSHTTQVPLQNQSETALVLPADHTGTKPNEPQNNSEFGDFAQFSMPSDTLSPLQLPSQDTPGVMAADKSGDNDGWADFSSAPLPPAAPAVTKPPEEPLLQPNPDPTPPPPTTTTTTTAAKYFQMSCTEAPTIDGMEKDLLSKLTSSVTVSFSTRPVEKKKEETAVKPQPVKRKKQEVGEEERWRECLERCGEILKSCVAIFESVDEEEIVIEITENQQSHDKLHSLAEIYRFAKRIHATLSTRHHGNRIAEADEVRKNWKQLNSLLPNNTMEELYKRTCPSDPVETDVLSDTISQCAVCLMGKNISISSSISLDDHTETYTLPLVFHQGHTFHSTCANFWRHCISEEVPSNSIISNN